MRVAILGTGGVGGYFGGRLAAAGTDVTFVARGAHLDAIRKRGLRIVSPLGDVTVERANAVDDIAKVGTVDLVIVAVKLWDTERVAPTLKPLTAGGAAVVSLQNGVQKDEVLRRHLPAAAVIGGLCYIAAEIAEPGVIRQTGKLQRLVFGEYDGTRSPRVQSLLDACLAAGIDAAVSAAIERQIWEKFVFLVGLSGTTASMRMPIGPIRENPRTRRFLLDAMREVVAVGRARGVPIPEDYADERLAFIDTLPGAMAASMANDLERGNRLELAWLSGGVEAMGRDLGLGTPVNRSIHDVLALHEGGRPDRARH